MLIGLMGKSGSGKTTISLLFKEINANINIIEIDKIGHASHNDPFVKKKLFNAFGNKIFNSDGSVDRKKLATIVFNDSDMMQKLYDATSEFMENKIEESIKENTINILDYALLPKLQIYKKCDLTILVTCDDKKRCKRILTRDNISVSKYTERNNCSLDYSLLNFNYTIINDGNINNLRKEIGKIYEESIISRKF